MFCASSIGARVTSASACVSPRWKIAEPCARGSTPTSQVDRAQILIAAAVHALLFVEHADAESFLLHVIERLRDRELVGLGEFLEHRRFHFFVQRVDRFAAVNLLLVVERAFDAIARDLIGDFEDLLVHRHQRHLAFRFADLRREFFLDADHFLRVSMREFERLDEIRFRQFRARNLRS